MSLVKGTDFNCTGSICYGIGGRDAQFQQLQMLLSATLARLGIGSAIAVDGKIGAETIQAILALAKLQPYLNSAPIQKVKASPKPETVATLVPELISALSDSVTVMSSATAARAAMQATSAASEARASAPSVPSYPLVPPQVPGQLPGTMPPPTMAPLPVAPRSRIGWWIAGIAGLGLAGFLLVKLAHHGQHDHPVEPPA